MCLAIELAWGYLTVLKRTIRSSPDSKFTKFSSHSYNLMNLIQAMGDEAMGVECSGDEAMGDEGMGDEGMGDEAMGTYGDGR